MNIDEVYDLIALSRQNLVKIAKTVRVDFEGLLKYYIVFEKIELKQALLMVSSDIVETYKDKEDLWHKVKQRLVIN